MLSETQIYTEKDKRLLVLLAFGALIILFHCLSAPAYTSQPPKSRVWFEKPTPGGRMLYRRSASASGPWDFVPAGPEKDSKPAGYQPLSVRAAFLLGRPLPINLAQTQELQMLPGIGPKLAQSIVSYRQAHGPISDRKSFMQVPGIGPRLSERLTPLLSFRDR